MNGLKDVGFRVKLDAVKQAIIDSGFHKGKAAKLLNVDRKTIYNILKKEKALSK